ncbi:ATP-binding protein [Streptomyces flaveolus]|uniref:ATP-binding protein n=1 Tax=Streptomyces flaveolus TaxID=67297 RepID=UPI003820C74F
MPYTFEVAIAPDPMRVAQTRRIAVAFLRYRAVPAPVAEDVVVAVSELVTNAIEHGQGAVSLRMRHADHEVLVEVTDDSPVPARLRTAAAHHVRGRGLFLVAALAQERWGVTNEGRTTWAVFRVPQGRS